MRSIVTVCICLAICSCVDNSTQTTSTQKALGAPAGVVALAQWNNEVLIPSQPTSLYASMKDADKAALFGIPNTPSQVHRAPAHLEHLGSVAEKRVFKGNERTVMLRDFDRYLRYGRQDLPETPGAVANSFIPDDAAAMVAATEWFGRLGLPAHEATSPIVRGLAAGGTSTQESTAPVVVGRIVEFPRRVNNVRVLDSSARFEFGQNGQLRTAMIYWPDFRIRPGLSRIRDRAAVEREVAGWSQVNGLAAAELVYTLDNDGFHVPGIMAHGVGISAQFFAVAE